MLKWLIEKWKVENSFEEICRAKIDIIVPICYAVLGKDRLASATELNFKQALNFLEMKPEAHLAFGNCTYFSEGEKEIEARLKREIFPELSSLKDFIEVSLENSINEAKRIRQALIDKGMAMPKCILIITGEIHSRRARRIWRKVFPGTKILVACISYYNETSKDYPIKDQQTTWRWLGVGVAAHLISYLPHGISFLENLHHKVKK
jgi:hypothetical protein